MRETTEETGKDENTSVVVSGCQADAYVLNIKLALLNYNDVVKYAKKHSQAVKIETAMLGMGCIDFDHLAGERDRVKAKRLLGELLREEAQPSGCEAFTRRASSREKETSQADKNETARKELL